MVPTLHLSVTEAKTLTSAVKFSKQLKSLVALIAIILAAALFFPKAHREAVNVETAFSGDRHLLHDADSDRREVRPLPLLG
jgi:hypothetical protein